MEPGRELDRQIAEKVLGLPVKLGSELKGVETADYANDYWIPIRDQNLGTPYQQWTRLPNYSTRAFDALTLSNEVLSRDDKVSWVYRDLCPAVEMHEVYGPTKVRDAATPLEICEAASLRQTLLCRL